MTDTQLLDVLQAMHDASKSPYVVCRESSTGRGWRLHSSELRESSELLRISPSGARSLTVRAAIETYAKHVLKRDA